MKKDGFLLFGILFGLTTWISGGHYVQANLMQYTPPQTIDTPTLTEDTHEEVFKKLEKHIDEIYEKNLTKSNKTQQTLTTRTKNDPRKVEQYNTLVATREIAIAMLAEIGGDISGYEHIAFIGIDNQPIQIQNNKPVKKKKEKKVVEKTKKIKKDKKTKKVAKKPKKSRKSKAS